MGSQCQRNVSAVCPWSRQNDGPANLEPGGDVCGARLAFDPRGRRDGHCQAATRRGRRRFINLRVFDSSRKKILAVRGDAVMCLAPLRSSSTDGVRAVGIA